MTDARKDTTIWAEAWEKCALSRIWMPGRSLIIAFTTSLSHTRAHHLCAAIAGYAGQSERYARIYGHVEPNARSASLPDHELIAQACNERNEEEAIQRLALHLTKTALTVLAQMAPEYTSQ